MLLQSSITQMCRNDFRQLQLQFLIYVKKKIIYLTLCKAIIIYDLDLIKLLVYWEFLSVSLQTFTINDVIHVLTN